MKHNNRVFNKLFPFLLIIFFLSTCSSSIIKNNDTEKKLNKENSAKIEKKKEIEREKKILKKFSSDKDDKYSKLLVDLNRYTTNGRIYQKKYHKHLIGIAIEITENKGLKITEGSIGFYYDRKSQNKNRLYLGLDIDIKDSISNNYAKTSITLLRNHLKKILKTINSCKTIFNEKEIEGIVIGFRWYSYKFERVNLWIKAEDVIRFEKYRLTFEELVQRSTVTNTKGRIIMLSI